jgi:hypothetical protein
VEDHNKQSWHTVPSVWLLMPLAQCIEERFGLLGVNGVKALGEPAIHFCLELVGFGAFALLLLETTEAHGGAQLPRLRLFVAGNTEGQLEADFRRITGAPVSQIRRPEPTSFE